MHNMYSACTAEPVERIDIDPTNPHSHPTSVLLLVACGCWRKKTHAQAKDETITEKEVETAAQRGIHKIRV